MLEQTNGDAQMMLPQKIQTLKILADYDARNYGFLGARYDDNDDANEKDNNEVLMEYMLLE